MAIKAQLFNSCALTRWLLRTEVCPEGAKGVARNFALARLSVIMTTNIFRPFHQEVPCIGRIPGD
jgi:hypothetical protein